MLVKITGKTSIHVYVFTLYVQYLQVCTYTCIHTDAKRHKCTHNMHAFTICIHVSSFYILHKTKLTYAHITHQILHIQWGKCYTYKIIFAISMMIFSLFDHCRFPFLVCLNKLTEFLLWTATHSTISTMFWTFRKSVFEVVFLFPLFWYVFHKVFLEKSKSSN